MKFDMGFTAVLAVSVLLQGCSSQMIVEAKDAASQIKSSTAAQTEKLRDAPDVQPSSTRTTDAYVKVSLTSEHKAAELPDMFQKSMSIHREFTSIAEVAERVTFHSKFPVIISPEITESTGGASAQTPAATNTPSVTPLPGDTQQAPIAAAPPVRLEYVGNVSGFLDLAASRYGVSWRFVDGHIEIYRTLTKTFTVKAIPGVKSISADISNSEGPRVSSASSLSVWDGLDKTLNSMKSSYGKIYVNQATGTVTVTDIPPVLLQMESYIEQQNTVISRQVMLSVKILSVSSRNTDKSGVNLNAVFSNLTKNFGWSYSSAFTNDPNAASLNMRVLNTAGATSGAQGTTAIITALRAEGDVTVVTSWSGITLNNQPAPIVVGRDSGYLQSISTTTTANVGSTTTITPGTYVTGISMNMLPHILDNGELLLESTMSISSLANMFSQTAGGNSVQFPEIDKRKLQNSISMRSGQTLILTGFDRSTIDTGEESTGFGWLGGGVKRANNNKDMLVILITAITADKL